MLMKLLPVTRKLLLLCISPFSAPQSGNQITQGATTQNYKMIDYGAAPS
jgi:hypothetical protein